MLTACFAADRTEPDSYIMAVTAVQHTCLLLAVTYQESGFRAVQRSAAHMPAMVKKAGV
jgi:hypothetical protein